MMTGKSPGFFQAAAQPVGFLSRYDGELREPVMWLQGNPVSIRVESRSAALLLSQRRGIGPQDALKGKSPGLCRVVAAGNHGFPRLVTVTSGSFSGCLWEMRNTLELGGASQDSTEFAAIREGLISC